jgi:hypothetical protein
MNKIELIVGQKMLVQGLDPKSMGLSYSSKKDIFHEECQLAQH